MANPHAAAALIGHRAAIRVAGHEATYRRGADSVDGFCVLPGKQGQVEQGVAGSSSFNTALSDFEVEAACLEINGAVITPEPGDTIDVDFGGETQSFQMTQGPSRRVWDWADNHHQIRTLHTVPKPPAA